MSGDENEDPWDESSEEGKRKRRAPLPPTKKQLDFAADLGIDYPADVTRRALSRMIDEALAGRDKAGAYAIQQAAERDGEGTGCGWGCLIVALIPAAFFAVSGL